jgi:hypothetical protein
MSHLSSAQRHKSGLACSMFASLYKQLLICEEEEENNYSSVKLTGM